jgi:hypothetical protein
LSPYKEPLFSHEYKFPPFLVQGLEAKFFILSAPIKSSNELGMKESYNEGLANHIDPESCVDNGNIIGEALTGESVGWVLRN